MTKINKNTILYTNKGQTLNRDKNKYVQRMYMLNKLHMGNDVDKSKI